MIKIVLYTSVLQGLNLVRSNIICKFMHSCDRQFE